MRIAHLSDLHLMRGPFAAQPAAGLADAIGRLLSVEPRPDCVVITGDLADTGHPEEYATLRTILRRCPIPVHLLPGNHDDPAALIASFGDTPYLGNGVSPAYTVEYPQATLVIANSWVQGSPAGCLGPAQLAWIDQVLGARPDVPAFVCLHHPPVPVGIPFLDGMILDDAAGLAAVIGKHPHVVRVLAGHALATREHTMRSISASIDRAREVLGYAPRYSTLDALHEALAWLVANEQASVGGQEF